MLPPMADVLKLICWAVIGLFRSRASLEAEILTLRQQLNVLRRKSPKRLAFSNVDRLIFAGLYQIAPRILNALTIVEPETVIRWHRAGFRLFWRWKSRCRSGRPKVRAGNPPTDPRHEPGQSTVGRSADPWRTAQARNRRWPNLGRQIYGEAQEASIARVEDLSPQPRRRDRIDGPVCRSDNLISAALWLADFTARPTPNVMAGSDGAPDRRMDRPTTHRGLRLGKDAEILVRDRDCVYGDPRFYGSVLLNHRKNMSAHLSQHRFIGPLGLRDEMVERLMHSLDTIAKPARK